MPVSGTYNPRKVYHYRHTPTGIGWRWATVWTTLVGASFLVWRPEIFVAARIPVAVLGFVLFWFAFAWVSTLYRNTFNRPRWEWIALTMTPLGLFPILFTVYLAKALMTTVARTVIRTLLGTSSTRHLDPDDPMSPEITSGDLTPSDIYVRRLMTGKAEHSRKIMLPDNPEPDEEDFVLSKGSESDIVKNVNDMDHLQEDDLPPTEGLLHNRPEDPLGLKMELRTKFLMLGIPLTLLMGLTTFVVIFHLSGGFR